MRFSQRKGLVPVRETVQRDGIDESLRAKLWSALHLMVFDNAVELRSAGIDPATVAARLWIHFFCNPIDTLPQPGLAALGLEIRGWFQAAEWYELYDLVEQVAAELEGPPGAAFAELVNNFLASEMSAYRLIEGAVIDITSEEEIAAIEGALRDSSPLRNVRVHLSEALRLIGDRSNPDYRNSVKESISAVEAMCCSITGDRNASLGKAIKRLREARVAVHPSLEVAWSKIYGYTSDSGGIRHALTDDRTVTHAEAKYMLVTCSAFVSYLAELTAESGIPLQRFE